MATFTTRLGLRKPAGTEAVNVLTDVNNNYDTLDSAASSTVCTSTTRPASPFSGQVIYETNTNHILTWNGTAWKNSSIPIVASTADIIAPHEGLVIFDPTDGLLYVYRSAAWVGFLATGNVTHEGRWYQSVAQTITNVADNKIYFDTAVTTTTDITVSGTNNTDFTINRSGLWILSAGLRYGTATVGERHIFIATTADMAVGGRIAGASQHAGTIIALCNSTEFRVTAPTNICVGTYQSSGASRALSLSGQTIFFSATWLRP